MDVKIYDENLVQRGVLPVLGGQAVIRNNDVSTFSIDVNANSAMWGRFEHGWHIALYDEGRQMLTGMPDRITEDANLGIRNVTLSGMSHMRFLRDMITIPSPSNPVDAQSDSAYYKASGPAETVIKNLVRTHIGQSARPENRQPIVVDANGTRGANVAVNSRFQNLLEEVKVLASVGKLRVYSRMELNDSGIEIRFSVGEGKDLRRAARLSQTNGSVRGYNLEEAAPTVTRVLVAGQGEGTARSLILRSGNENDWGVNALAFQDRRDTDDAADLLQAGDETLAEGQESAAISVEVNDLPKMRFGERFDLGDTVSVELESGTTVQDVVQSVDITWSETGRLVKAQIGPVAEELDAPAWVKIVHDIRSQLRRVQAQ